MSHARDVTVICRSGDNSGVELCSIHASLDATLEAFRAMCLAEALPLPGQCVFLSLQGQEVTAPEERMQLLEQVLDAETQAVWVQAARAPAAGAPPPARRAGPVADSPDSLDSLDSPDYRERPLDIGTRSIQIPKTAEGMGMTLRNNPHTTTGVVVWTVQEGKVAWTAGLRVGDLVLSIEGHRLDSIDRLVEYVSEAEGDVRMEVSAQEWQVGRGSQPPTGLAAPTPPLVVPRHTPNGTSPGRGKAPPSDAMFSPAPQLSPQLPHEMTSPSKLTNHGDGRNGRSSPALTPPQPPQPPPPPVAAGRGSPLPPNPAPTTAGGGAGAVPGLSGSGACSGAPAAVASLLPAARRAAPHSGGGAALGPEELALLPKVRVTSVAEGGGSSGGGGSGGGGGGYGGSGGGGSGGGGVGGSGGGSGDGSPRPRRASNASASRLSGHSPPPTLHSPPLLVSPPRRAAPALSPGALAPLGLSPPLISPRVSFDFAASTPPRSPAPSSSGDAPATLLRRASSFLSDLLSPKPTAAAATAAAAAAAAGMPLQAASAHAARARLQERLAQLREQAATLTAEIKGDQHEGELSPPRLRRLLEASAWLQQEVRAEI